LKSLADFCLRKSTDPAGSQPFFCCSESYVVNGDGNVHRVGGNSAGHYSIRVKPDCGDDYRSLSYKTLIVSRFCQFLPGCCISNDYKLPGLSVTA
jgi:hypothetical protein